ncbi:MAG: YtxH domain-containing protein [Bacteroidales bacterium]|nr:YtxH domain-containing protein [Bacteroidales bacterium]
MKPNTLLAFIGGALAGAVVALLYAPDKGENIRRRMRERAEDEYNSLKARMRKDCAHSREEENPETV